MIEIRNDSLSKFYLVNYIIMGGRCGGGEVVQNDTETLQENAPKIGSIKFDEEYGYISFIQIDGEDFSKDHLSTMSSKCGNDNWTSIGGIGEKGDYGYENYKYSLAGHTGILTRNSDNKTFYIGEQLSTDIQETLGMINDQNNIEAETVNQTPAQKKMDSILQEMDSVGSDFFEYTEYSEKFHFIVNNWATISDSQVAEFKEGVQAYLAEYDATYGMPQLDNIQADQLRITNNKGTNDFTITHEDLPDGQITLYAGNKNRANGVTRSLK